MKKTILASAIGLALAPFPLLAQSINIDVVMSEISINGAISPEASFETYDLALAQLQADLLDTPENAEEIFAAILSLTAAFQNSLAGQPPEVIAGALTQIVTRVSQMAQEVQASNPSLSLETVVSNAVASSASIAGQTLAATNPELVQRFTATVAAAVSVLSPAAAESLTRAVAVATASPTASTPPSEPVSASPN